MYAYVYRLYNENFEEKYNHMEKDKEFMILVKAFNKLEKIRF